MEISKYAIDVFGKVSEYSLVTENLLLISDEKYMVDTSSSPVTLTLPATPSHKDEIIIFDSKATFDEKNVTLTSSAKINGSDDDLVLDLKGLKAILMYVDETIGWKMSDLDSRFLKSYEINTSEKADDLVLQYNKDNDELEYVEYQAQTEAPTLSGISEGVEITEATITITNYSADNIYSISVTGGSTERSGDTITWTLPEVDSDSNHIIFVRAENTVIPMGESVDGEHTILVTNVPVVGDQALAVTDFSDFIEDGEGYEFGSVIATQDDAWVLTKPELQESEDTDWGQQQVTVKVTVPEYEVDASSTTSSLVLNITESGVLSDGDSIIVKNTGSNDLIDIVVGDVSETAGEYGYSVDRCVGGTAFGNSTSGRVPSRAFDNLNTSFSADAWCGDINPGPAIVGYDFGSGNEKTITKFVVYCCPRKRTDYLPYNFTFQGSNDNSEWTTLQTASNETWAGVTSLTYTFTNNTTYRYYQLKFLSNGSTGGEFVEIGEIEMMESIVVTSPNTTCTNMTPSLTAVPEKVFSSDLPLVYSALGSSSVEVVNNYGNLFIDGESVIEDENGNHTITNSGCSVSTSEKVYGESSVYFSGSDYLTIDDSIDWEFGSDDFTIDFWFRLDDIVSYHRLVSQWRSGNNSNQAFYIYTYNDGLFVWIENGSGTRIFYLASESSLSANTWYHTAIVRNSTTCKLYLDGIEKSSDTSSEAITSSSSKLTIGVIEDNDGSVLEQYQFKGYMDNIRIIKGVALWTENFNTSTDMKYTLTTGINEPIFKDDKVLTNLTNVSTTGLTGENSTASLWVTGGNNMEIGLTVNGSEVITDVLTVSEVEGEYTADLCEGGTATASGYDYGHLPSGAFDGILDSGYQWSEIVASETATNWIQYQFTSAKKISKVRIFSFYESGFEVIKDFTIQASNTGVFGGEQVTLLTDTHPNDTTEDFVDYIFENNNSYSYYRVVINSHYFGNGNNDRSIREIEMMEMEDTEHTVTFAEQTHAPTAAWKPALIGGNDTKLTPETKTYVPASDNLEVQYELNDFSDLDNMRQLKYYVKFNKSGDEWNSLQADLWKKE